MFLWCTAALFRARDPQPKWHCLHVTRKWHFRHLFTTIFKRFPWTMWHILYAVCDTLIRNRNDFLFLQTKAIRNNTLVRLGCSRQVQTSPELKNLRLRIFWRIGNKNYLSWGHRGRLYDRPPNIYRIDRNSILNAPRHRQWNSFED